MCAGHGAGASAALAGGSKHTLVSVWRQFAKTTAVTKVRDQLFVSSM